MTVEKISYKIQEKINNDYESLAHESKSNGSRDTYQEQFIQTMQPHAECPIQSVDNWNFHPPSVQKISLAN